MPALRTSMRSSPSAGSGSGSSTTLSTSGPPNSVIWMALMPQTVCLDRRRREIEHRAHRVRRAPVGGEQPDVALAMDGPDAVVPDERGLLVDADDGCALRRSREVAAGEVRHPALEAVEVRDHPQVRGDPEAVVGLLPRLPKARHP